VNTLRKAKLRRTNERLSAPLACSYEGDDFGPGNDAEAEFAVNHGRRRLGDVADIREQAAWRGPINTTPVPCRVNAALQLLPAHAWRGRVPAAAKEEGAARPLEPLAPLGVKLCVRLLSLGLEHADNLAMAVPAKVRAGRALLDADRVVAVGNGQPDFLHNRLELSRRNRRAVVVHWRLRRVQEEASAAYASVGGDGLKIPPARRTREGSRGSGPLLEVPLTLGAAPTPRSGRCSVDPWPSGSLTLTRVAMYVDDVVVACSHMSGRGAEVGRHDGGSRGGF